MHRDDYRAFIGKKARSAEEDQIQMALVAHLQIYAYPDAIWYAVLNGAKRTPAAGRKAKAMGLVNGVYDLAGAVPGGQAWHLELKTRDGVLSADQITFGERCERNGALQAVCYSLDDALTWLRAIGVLRPEAV